MTKILFRRRAPLSALMLARTSSPLPRPTTKISALRFDELGCKSGIFPHHGFKLFIVGDRLTNGAKSGRKIWQCQVKNGRFPTSGSRSLGHELHTNADPRNGRWLQ